MQLFVNGKVLDNCKGLLAVLRKKKCCLLPCSRDCLIKHDYLLSPSLEFVRSTMFTQNSELCGIDPIGRGAISGLKMCFSISLGSYVLSSSPGRKHSFCKIIRLDPLLTQSQKWPHHQNDSVV